MRNLLLLALLAGWVGMLQAQRLPKMEELDKALSYSKEYPDDEFVAENYTSTYRYTCINTYGNRIALQCKVQSNLNMMALEHRSDYRHNQFFDDNSERGSIKVTMNNGKKVQVKLDEFLYRNNGIFHTDTRVASFLIPFRYEGEIRKISWDNTYNDLRYLTSVYFQESHPVKSRKLVFVVPKWMDLEIKEFNFEGYEITKEVKGNPGEFNHRITYTATNLPGYADENRAPGHAHLFPHIVLLHKSYTFERKNYPLFRSSDDLYSWYSKLVKGVDEDPEELDDLAQKIVGESTDPIEKTRKVYYWVQDNVRYLAFEDGIAGYQPESSNEVCENRYGDCKGMANLAKQLLGRVGVEAKLAWIGTRDRPYSYSLPSLIVDNHMICVAEIEGRNYFLDPTEKFLPLGEIGERLQGKEIMIENGDSYHIDTVPSSSAKSNLVARSYHLKLKDGKLIGNGTVTLNGQERTDLLHSYHYAKMQSRTYQLRRLLGEEHENLILNKLELPNFKQRDSALHFSFGVELEHRVSTIGARTLVYWDPGKDFAGFELDEERKSPLWLGNKLYQTVQITLEIPDSLELLEQPEDFKAIGKDFELEVSYSQKGNSLVCEKRLVIFQGTIAPNQFSAWNEAIRQLNRKVYSIPLVLQPRKQG